MELKLIDEKGAGTINAPDRVRAHSNNPGAPDRGRLQGEWRIGSRAEEPQRRRHSTKKPFRQKGTGRARAGMTSSPLWRGGGKIFPNSPDENFSHKVNRKMYRAGITSILSQLAREDRIRVIDEFKLDAPKTRLLAQKVRSMGFGELLVITDEVDENLMLSARNLPHVQVIAARQANPVTLIRYTTVLLTKKAVAQLEEMFK